MATLREIITRSMNEGYEVTLYSTNFDSTMTYLGDENTSEGNESPSIPAFYASVEKELLDLGWEKCDRSDKIYQFTHLRDANIYRLGYRYADISTTDEDGWPFDVLETPKKMIAKLYISESFEYGLQVQEERGDGWLLYSCYTDFEEVNEVLLRHGWVVTEPTDKIADEYFYIEGAVFYEKGDFFAVTGIDHEQKAFIINNKNFRAWY